MEATCMKPSCLVSCAVAMLRRRTTAAVGLPGKPASPVVEYNDWDDDDDAAEGLWASVVREPRFWVFTVTVVVVVAVVTYINFLR